jgi:hypothetical protein
MRLQRLVGSLTLAIVTAAYPAGLSAQANVVTPLKTISASSLSQPLTSFATNIPLADTTPFKVNNALRIAGNIDGDDEYVIVTGVTQSTSIDVARGKLGTSAKAHDAQKSIDLLYQLDVLISSPNPIGAYQLNVTYDPATLSLDSVNVFKGTGALGTPLAVNASTAGSLILNSFNATAFFQGAATPVARVYFSGKLPTVAGSTNISVNLTNLSDTTGNDLDTSLSGVVATPSANNPLVVTVFDVIGKRVRGQITSQ